MQIVKITNLILSDTKRFMPDSIRPNFFKIKT